MKKSGKNRARTILFGTVSAIIGLLVPLVLLEIGLRFLPVTTGLSSVAVDDNNPIIRYSPNRNFVWSKGWNLAFVNRGRVNNDGFVNDLNYEKPRAGPSLIAVIGDSFVEAKMVPYRETIQGRLSEHLGNRGRVYSFASGGSALSQYLAYAEYASQAFAPESMIFVIISNDFDESLITYKSSPAFHYFIEDARGDLSLTRVDFRPSLAIRVLRRSALARYLVHQLNFDDVIKRFLATLRNDREAELENYVGNVPSESDVKRVADSMRAIDAFLDQLTSRSGLPVARHLFVIDGIRPNLYEPSELEAANGSYFDIMRKHFIRAAESRGYEIIDMQPLFVEQFKKDGLRFEFPTDFHWNGHAHGVAADAIIASRNYLDMLVGQSETTKGNMPENTN